MRKQPIFTVKNWPEFILGMTGLIIIATQNWVIALGIFIINLKQSEN